MPSFLKRFSPKDPSWAYPLMMLFASLVPLLGLLVLLLELNNRPVSSWKVSFLTPNTVVAILTAATTIPLESVLSQATFQLLVISLSLQSQRLGVINTVLKAAFGSLQSRMHVVFRGKFWLSKFICLLLIAKLVVDALTQNTLAIKEVQKFTGDVTVAIASVYNDSSPGLYSLIPDTTFAFAAASYTGLFAFIYHLDLTNLYLGARSPTGNATFPPYVTSAIGGFCVDRTPQIVAQCPPDYNTSTSCNFTLSGTDIGLFGSGAVFNASGLGGFLAIGEFKDYPQQLFNWVGIVRHDDGSVTATQCVDYWSVWRCDNTSMQNGQLQEFCEESHNATADYSDFAALNHDPERYFCAGTDNYTSPLNQSDARCITRKSTIAIQQRLGDDTTGSISYDADGQADFQYYSSKESIIALYNTMKASKSHVSVSSVDSGVYPNSELSPLERQLASRRRAMANVLRRDDSLGSKVHGQAFVMQPYIDFRWQWILPISILWALSALGLFAAFAASKHNKFPRFEPDPIALMAFAPRKRAKVGPTKQNNIAKRGLRDEEAAMFRLCDDDDEFKRLALILSNTISTNAVKRADGNIDPNIKKSLKLVTRRATA